MNHPRFRSRGSGWSYQTLYRRILATVSEAWDSGSVAAGVSLGTLATTFDAIGTRASTAMQEARAAFDSITARTAASMDTATMTHDGAQPRTATSMDAASATLGTISAQAAVTMPTTAQVHAGPTAQASATMTSATMTHDGPGARGSASMSSASQTHNGPGPRSTASITRYRVVDMTPDKDTWVTQDGTCLVDDANHDADGSLHVDVAQSRVSYLGWDLSGLPDGTVAEATLTLSQLNNPLAAPTCQTAKLADADEGWNETTLKCSTAPANTDVEQQTGANQPQTVTWTLGAGWRSRIGERLSVGVFTIVLEGIVGQERLEFSDKETGGTPAKLSFTVDPLA